MPAFLRKHKFEDVTDGKACVFQPAYHTDLDTYTYFSQHPENLTALIKYMGLEQDVRGRWLKQYPFREHTRDWRPSHEDALFVDIGGNVGHYCALFKNAFPELPGRIVLEDLAGTLGHALPTPGVEKLQHDFFKEQPIKGEFISGLERAVSPISNSSNDLTAKSGAKFYHLGWILHNWSEEPAKKILREIKSAMAPHSVLLINDMILPDVGASPFTAAMDLVMLGACGSLERTEQQWKDLLGEVGLKIDEAVVYDEKSFHGLISATLA